jgi:hypothetical protein
MENCLNWKTERVFWDSVLNKPFRNSNVVNTSPYPLWLYVTAFVWILAVAFFNVFFNVLHTSSESVMVN